MNETKPLEQQVIEEIRKSVAIGVASQLTGYNSPFNSLVKEVFENHRAEITKVVDTIVAGLAPDKKFVAILKEEFQHKVAKDLVGKLEGAVEKAGNDYRNDPLRRAKMIEALERIINS